jgi:hypothetical protein
MDLLDQMHRTSFLGAEFLTWLWYRSEVQEGNFALDSEFGAFELWFEDKLVVGSPAIDAQENHFKGGHPTTSQEARIALRLGKLAREAKLRVVRGNQEWMFTFKSETLATNGIKIPAVLTKEDSEKFYERMELIEQLDQMMKGLFAQFLAIRLSPKWDSDELPALQAWVRAA